MKRQLRAIAAAGLLLAGGLVAVVVSTPAQADTLICDAFGTTTIQGRYVVQNNRWGTSAQQCINVTDTGFAITAQQGQNPTNGGPVSYPSVYLGCHYTNCSPGTNLPMQVSQISSATSSISYRYVGGATYNASYDIWLDPTPRTNGANSMEIMIWLNRQGPIQPIGSVVGNTTIGGRTWEVWQGSNGMNNVISYVAPSPITSLSFSVLDFINDVRNRGVINNSWYLTSIQAGYEPWVGGTGLAVTSFAAAVNGGGAPNPGTPTPGATTPGSPTPGATTPAPGGTAAPSGTIVSSQASRCLDVPNEVQTSGTRLVLWTCSGNVNQRFTTTAARELRVYGTRCLDAFGMGTTPGTPVIIWDCNGGNNQKWTVNSNGTITNAHNGLCLDSVNAGTANGTLIQLSTCNGAASQRWTRG